MADQISSVTLPNNNRYDIKAIGIPFGQVDSTSTSTAFTATISGITDLYDGVCMWLRNGVINSASGFTIDINSLGAKPVYYSFDGSRSATGFAKARTFLFVYNSSRVSGGCWDFDGGFYTNTMNTAGATDTSSKIYLIGATSQASSPQTYSDNEVYTTSGVLTTKKVQVGGTSCTMEYNSTTQSLDFVFS